MLNPTQRSVGVALGSFKKPDQTKMVGFQAKQEDRRGPSVFHPEMAKREVSTLQVVAVVPIDASVMLHVTTHGGLNASTARLVTGHSGRLQISRLQKRCHMSKVFHYQLLHGDGSGSCIQYLP